MIVLAVYKCSRLCANFHVGTFRLHTNYYLNLKFPARTSNGSRLKFFKYSIFEFSSTNVCIIALRSAVLPTNGSSTSVAVSLY